MCILQHLCTELGAWQSSIILKIFLPQMALGDHFVLEINYAITQNANFLVQRIFFKVLNLFNPIQCTRCLVRSVFREPAEGRRSKSSGECWQTGAAIGPYGTQDTCSGGKLGWQDYHWEQPVGELGESRAAAGDQAGIDLSTGTGVLHLFGCLELYILISVAIVA